MRTIRIDAKDVLHTRFDSCVLDAPRRRDRTFARVAIDATHATRARDRPRETRARRARERARATRGALASRLRGASSMGDR